MPRIQHDYEGTNDEFSEIKFDRTHGASAIYYANVAIGYYDEIVRFEIRMDGMGPIGSFGKPF